MPEERKFRAQGPKHVQIIKAPEPARHDQRRSSCEAQDELDLTAAKIAVKLTERNSRQHRRIDRDGEFAPIRELNCDHVIGAEPETDEVGCQAFGAPIILAIA